MKARVISLVVILLLMCVLVGGRQREVFVGSVTERVIYIPGLEDEYKFLLLSDNHIIVMDESDDEPIKDEALIRMKEFVNNDGITSADQFPYWIEYANKNSIDMVLMAGDMIDYASDTNIDYIYENLEKLETAEYIYTLGNHDWTTVTDYMTPYGKEVYLPKMKKLTGENTFVNTKEYDQFIILSIDNSANQVNPEAMEEIKRVFELGKPVIMVMHVPIGNEEILIEGKKIWSSGVVMGLGNWGGIYENETTSEFMSLLSEEDCPVIAILAGHVHVENESIYNGKIIEYTAPPGFSGKGTVITVKSLPKAGDQPLGEY